MSDQLQIIKGHTFTSKCHFGPLKYHHAPCSFFLFPLLMFTTEAQPSSSQNNEKKMHYIFPQRHSFLALIAKKTPHIM